MKTKKISPASFSLFSFLTQLTVNAQYINFCRLLDLNHGPLELEATALPTEPQPLAYCGDILPIKLNETEMNWLKHDAVLVASYA